MKPHLSKLPSNSLFLFLIFLWSCVESGDDPNPGTDGLNALVEIITESAGGNCTNGGVQIIAGSDSNENGELDATEIISTTFICHANTSTILSSATPEAPGDNCSDGGSLIEIGNDNNENGTLDADEIEVSYFVCNGSNGTSNLVIATEEEAGANCSAGGIKLELGSDDNSNGLLDSEEITSTSYICHGLDGSDGSNSLILIESEAPGSNCPNGGLVIHVGLDTDASGTLDEAEYVGTAQYICTGSTGKTPMMISQTATSCPSGGLRLTFGYDDNEDGTLVDGQDTILETLTLCNGDDGLNTLITTSTVGTSCSNGGVLFEIGFDENGNNTLDTEEITTSQSICNGEDGIMSLYSLTPLEEGNALCINGGILVEAGTDINGNNILDPGEVNEDLSASICNGSSDGVYEFYFTEGVDGYTGVTECTISDYPTPSVFATDSLIAGFYEIIVGRTNADVAASGYSFFPLIRFDGIETIANQVPNDYFIAEATLFLNGSLTYTYSGNRIDVNHLVYPSDNILFDATATFDNKATIGATTYPWGNGETFSQSDQGGDFDVFSMLQRGSGDAFFDGIIPLSLDRSYVEAWISGENHGVALSLLDENVDGAELLYIKKSNHSDPHVRPTLYIKVKELSTSGRISRSEQEYQKWWQSLTYEEKIAPLLKR